LLTQAFFHIFRYKFKTKVMKQLDKEDYKFIITVLIMVGVIFIGMLHSNQNKAPKQFGVKIEKHY
jgi:hypothetical protein